MRCIVEPKKDKILQIMSNPEKIRKAIKAGINAALLDHKLAGNPVCVWDSTQGKVVWIQPEDIPIK